MRVYDYSETSQVVAMFTRSGGMIRLIAKGSKRAKSKTGGAIDLLAEGDLVYSTGRGEGLATLMEFSEAVSRRQLRRSAERLYAALLLVELAGEMLGEGDPHPEAFDLLHNALIRLADADAPTAAVIAWYQWRLLRHAGLLGQMDRCIVCDADLTPTFRRQNRRVFFSSGLGGLVCDDCHRRVEEKLLLDEPAMAGLAVLTAAEAGRRVRLPDPQADSVNRLLLYHGAHQLGKPVRLARHVLSERNLGPARKAEPMTDTKGSPPPDA